MHIIQVSTADRLGGAERVALSLHQRLRENNHDSRLCVGWKHTQTTAVDELCPDRDNSYWKQCFINIALNFERNSGKKWCRHTGRLARALGDPAEFLRWWRGLEEFHYGKTRQLLAPPYDQYALLHLHNLHGGYFDLRLLPELCDKYNVIITMHDEWLYTGHCAYSMDCQRWQAECGQCPYPETYPAVRMDNTEANLDRKKKLYRESRLNIVTPSRWLMDRVKQSILADSIAESLVIPNGVDSGIFFPGDKIAARKKLGLEQDAYVLLFMANYFRSNRFKDYETVLQAAIRAGEKTTGHRKIILVAVGEDTALEHVDQIELDVRPYIADQAMTACYFQAADIYLHAAHSEIWGLTITEAMATGVPVIATRTGGIPEQVNSLDTTELDERAQQGTTTATGILVGKKDSAAMADAICLLLENEQLRKQLGDNATRHVNNHYTLEHMFSAYTDFYKNILGQQLQ